MINFANGEAVPAERPALTRLLRLYALQEARMNLRDKDTPEAEADEIEAEYHRLIGAIADPKTVCTTKKDALAALQFIKAEFNGESFMADRLIHAVIDWVKSEASQDALRQVEFWKRMENGHSQAALEAHG